jgi:hypothetical protein
MKVLLPLEQEQAKVFARLVQIHPEERKDGQPPPLEEENYR